MNLKKNARTEEKWGFAAIEEAVRTAVKHAYWDFFRETDLDSEELGRSQESARPKDNVMYFMSNYCTISAGTNQRLSE